MCRVSWRRGLQMKPRKPLGKASEVAIGNRGGVRARVTLRGFVGTGPDTTALAIVDEKKPLPLGCQWRLTLGLMWLYPAPVSDALDPLHAQENLLHASSTRLPSAPGPPGPGRGSLASTGHIYRFQSRRRTPTPLAPRKTSLGGWPLGDGCRG